MRRAFSLIELLVVVAIIAVMVVVGLVSVQGGRQAAQVKAAARDVYAAIRNARSRAIVTGNRVVVNFHNETQGEETCLKVDVDSAMIMKTSIDRGLVQRYYVTDLKKLPQRGVDASVKETDDGEGETMEEILFAPMDAYILKGMRVKFKRGEDFDDDLTEVQRESRISVYSSADYWLQRYAEAKGVTNRTETAASEPISNGAPKRELDASGSDDSGMVVWETNGSVDPHRIWVYPDGLKPEDGLVLDVDRFGAIKILSGDGSDDDR